MAQVNVQADIDLENPVLVEGLPGVGLVGKIAVDHLVDSLGMEYYASVDCDGIPRLAVYAEDDRSVRPPVRLYADADRDLLALQSDVPVSRTAAAQFATCVTGWIEEHDVLPVYLSGMAVEERASVPAVFGVSTGDAAGRLDGIGVDAPAERGAIGGPTGALLNRAAERGLAAVGLVTESDPQFPDPAAARQVLVDGIEPLADVEVPTDDLVERAEEIRSQKEQFARQMQEADEEQSSQAKPVGMFQ